MSIRPSWGYRPDEDGKLPLPGRPDDLVRALRRRQRHLLLLNVPPNPDGLLPPGDVRRLEEMGREIARIFSDDRTAAASASSADTAEGYDPAAVLAEGRDSHWQAWENASFPSLRLSPGGGAGAQPGGATGGH